MSKISRHSGESLVPLYLAAAQHIVPAPDKSAVAGRVVRLLRSVGSSGSISVRARMITLVTSTKFTTTSGLPISLVGLHGKDEILVVGPTWAVERLANGEMPPIVPDGVSSMDARATVEFELYLLTNLPALLATPLSPEQSEARVKVLGAMFRASIDIIEDFFRKHDATEFRETMIQEARAVLAVLEEAPYQYPRWWAGWDTAQNATGTDPLHTVSGRHVTTYPIARADGQYLAKARNRDELLLKSMMERLTAPADCSA